MSFGCSSRFGRWSAFAFSQDGVLADLKSAVEKGLSKAGLMLFMQLDHGAIGREEIRDDKKN
jgi:hypothetical protein